MENQINVGDQKSQQINLNPKVNYWMISTIVLFLILFISGGLYFFNLKTKISPAASATQPIKTDISTGWRRANLSLVTFDYPPGWHVSSSWPNEAKGYITIVLDPNPLDGAPRGGPTTTIMIKDYNGIDNPEEQLSRNLAESKKNITDVKEIKFIAGNTTFYKLEGKSNFYNEMVPILEYHALLKGPSTNNINIHVIQADLTYYTDNEDRKKYAEILDRLVKSMRHKDEN